MKNLVYLCLLLLSSYAYANNYKIRLIGIISRGGENIGYTTECEDENSEKCQTFKRQLCENVRNAMEQSEFKGKFRDCGISKDDNSAQTRIHIHVPRDNFAYDVWRLAHVIIQGSFAKESSTPVLFSAQYCDCESVGMDCVNTPLDKRNRMELLSEVFYNESVLQVRHGVCQNTWSNNACLRLSITVCKHLETLLNKTSFTRGVFDTCRIYLLDHNSRILVRVGYPFWKNPRKIDILMMKATIVGNGYFIPITENHLGLVHDVISYGVPTRNYAYRDYHRKWFYVRGVASTTLPESCSNHWMRFSDPTCALLYSRMCKLAKEALDHYDRRKDMYEVCYVIFREPDGYTELYLYMRRDYGSLWPHYVIGDTLRQHMTPRDPFWPKFINIQLNGESHFIEPEEP